ncbi:unnamed protein product [Cuscuta campestris]|uniref:Reverse transcriptase zinc-binding domain-containing protein n=1 Tax=Cuscuta campestris TaxID=132261 RepID=A0A484KUV3_9ASTE|nr:unnamed protein product [Cuscuta campestris]
MQLAPVFSMANKYVVVIEEAMNDASIVLILEKNSPETVTDLRPIALRNIIYNIVAKILGSLDKAIHWLSWKHMAEPKTFGGIGFKHLHSFNIAMLEAKLEGTPSYCWRSILAAQALTKAGARRRIGNGFDTLVWGSPWLLDAADPRACLDSSSHWPNFPIAFLINSESGYWGLQLLHQLFSQRDIDSDCYRWDHS